MTALRGWARLFRDGVTGLWIATVLFRRQRKTCRLKDSTAKAWRDNLRPHTLSLLAVPEDQAAIATPAAVEGDRYRYQYTSRRNRCRPHTIAAHLDLVGTCPAGSSGTARTTSGSDAAVTLVALVALMPFATVPAPAATATIAPEPSA